MERAEYEIKLKKLLYDTNTYEKKKNGLTNKIQNFINKNEYYVKDSCHFHEFINNQVIPKLG